MFPRGLTLTTDAAMPSPVCHLAEHRRDLSSIYQQQAHRCPSFAFVEVHGLRRVLQIKVRYVIPSDQDQIHNNVHGHLLHERTIIDTIYPYNRETIRTKITHIHAATSTETKSVGLYGTPTLTLDHYAMSFTSHVHVDRTANLRRCTFLVDSMVW